MFNCQILEGYFEGKDLRIALVVSRFNIFITQKLLEGALDVLRRHQVDEKNISVAWVPGAFEIPLVAKKLARSGKFDAVICLGAIIRGATPHFESVAAIEQAIERAGTKAGNKGAEAAYTAIEVVNLLKKISNF